MKTQRVSLRSISGLLFIVSAFCISAHAGDKETKARREFLFNLGFNDVPKEIRERIEAHNYLTVLNLRQMEANAVAYEAVSSRELSLLILDETEFATKDLSSALGTKMARFTAKMLAMKPLAPATDYPTEILNMPKGEARETALVDWLHQQRARQMLSHKNRLFSDVVSLL